MRGALPLLILLTATAGGVLALVVQRDPRLTSSGPTRVAGVDEVADIEPLLTYVPMEEGADRRLQRAHYAVPDTFTLGAPRGGLVQTPVYLVRDGAEIRAFIATDPRNACPIRWDGAFGVFREGCHGATYERETGRIVGGPGLFELNRLAVLLREKNVFVDPAQIIIGGCPECAGLRNQIQSSATPPPAATPSR